MPFVDGMSVRDSLDAPRRGLIPDWCNDPTGGRKPINGKCETVDRLPTFREAYGRRRCIVPVDGFFEWKAIRGREPSSPTARAAAWPIAWTKPKRRSGRPLQDPPRRLPVTGMGSRGEAHRPEMQDWPLLPRSAAIFSHKPVQRVICNPRDPLAATRSKSLAQINKSPDRTITT
jgi:hypothetical protein